MPAGTQAGWGVRQPEAVELHLSPPPGSTLELPVAATDDVPESDLVALRASVNERLRKKKCDDAAAVLQQAAQELGGEAVAELALDAGDRCRTLGKRNAALNCYLAASRADPVYEPPLARLADICIDDQDIDLAVSYLERIARLTRLRGDTRGALRVYRRIATIAPYRDDVLEMLMRAQTTGRIDP
jgi:tetratricopeptide (TPR) repeat protein